MQDALAHRKVPPQDQWYALHHNMSIMYHKTRAAEDSSGWLQMKKRKRKANVWEVDTAAQSEA